MIVAFLYSLSIVENLGLYLKIYRTKYLFQCDNQLKMQMDNNLEMIRIMMLVHINIVNTLISKYKCIKLYTNADKLQSRKGELQ